MSAKGSSAFHRVRGELFCEEVPLARLAEAVGTPAYVYSRARLLRNYRAIAEDKNAPDLVCYAVKALPNLAVLKLLADAGSGFDVVSGGELARVLTAGGDPSKVVFSGVGKTDSELAEALWAGVGCFNIESEEELVRLSAIASRLEKTAPIALRVNPAIDVRTHPYIATALAESKFGIPLTKARALYAAAAKLPEIEVAGVDFHLGSQITSLAPFRAALSEIRRLLTALEDDGHKIRHLDIGGGLGIGYGGKAPSPAEWLAVVRKALKGVSPSLPLRLPLKLIVEPGRSIAGDAGALLARVLGRKSTGKKRFVLVDAAMNDLLRPALYHAHHEIVPIAAPRTPTERVDVVGPICESGDFLAEKRRLPTLAAGDLIAVLDAGAYGFSMGSNYNARPRAPEVLVYGGSFRVIREREKREDLWRGESV